VAVSADSLAKRLEAANDQALVAFVPNPNYPSTADLIVHAPVDLAAALEVVRAAEEAWMEWRRGRPLFVRLRRALDAFEALP
jgi:hypothetical protein